MLGPILPSFHTTTRTRFARMHSAVINRARESLSNYSAVRRKRHSVVCATIWCDMSYKHSAPPPPPICISTSLSASFEWGLVFTDFPSRLRHRDYCATRRPRGSLCTLLHGSVGACLRAVRRCRERAWGLLLLFNLTPIHIAIPPAKTRNTSRLLNRISYIVVSKIQLPRSYEHQTCQRPKLRDKEALTRYVESHEGESQTNRDESHVETDPSNSH